MSDPKRALDRLLASDLPDEERAALQARVDAGEEASAILEDADSMSLLAATAGDDALSDDEADDLFAAILGEVDTPVEEEQAPANNNRGWMTGIAIAAVALLAMTPLLLPDEPYTGIKGDDDLVAPELRVFVGDGQGGVGAELKNGDSVKTGTPVIFRYKTTRQASAWLLVDEGGKASSPWHSPLQKAGDFEVQTDGTALAWVVDSQLDVGLLLIGPQGIPGTPTLAASCIEDTPCARFSINVSK